MAFLPYKEQDYPSIYNIIDIVTIIAIIDIYLVTMHLRKDFTRIRLAVFSKKYDIDNKLSQNQ